MGVHGLWQLLQPAGRPVSLESLEGKVLAVDVSIWLHQTMKGMRDKDGNPLPNAHLQGLFSRVCKLLFYRIKPVFVFDGGVPVLKKKTLAARRDRREEAERESSAVAEKLLENLVKSHAVKEVLGGGGLSSSSKSKPGKVPGVRKGRNQKLEDIFELAPLPDSEEVNLVQAAQQWEQDFEQQENWIKEGLAALSDTHPDADEFKSLPGEIQHEILRELKERKKYHSLSHLTKMPEASEDFSSYQLKRLMKKCRLTTRMEEIRKEMTNQTAIDITAQYTGEDCDKVKNQFGDQVEARRIVSEDASHYVLIKGISSDSQLRQADKYHLEQTVKVEEVDSDTDAKGNNSDGRIQSSPDKSRKSSVKIVSTDESDSDIETVVARRFKKKGKRKAWAVKRNTQGLDREKIAAALKVKEEKVQPEQTKKGNPVVETSSSSEDEGFIEVTVDADAPIEGDELFPASIFERPAQGHDGISDILTIGETKGRPKTKDAEKRAKQNPVQEQVGEKRKVAVDNKSHRVVQMEKADSDRCGSTIKKGKDLLERVNSPVKENAEGEVETAATKRKNVLSDILGQLREKKKKLQEEVEEIKDMDDLPSEQIGKQDEFTADFSSVERSEVISDQDEEEVKVMGGGFIPEGSSEEDVSIKPGMRQNGAVGAEVRKVGPSAKNFLSHDTSHEGRETYSDSDDTSDEDLKLAKELSLQTGQTQARHQDKESELDEDLKLAIQLSLEASKPEEERASSSKDTAKSQENDANFHRRLSNHSKTIVTEEEEEVDWSEEEEEVEDEAQDQQEKLKERDDESVSPSTSSSKIGQVRQQLDETRLQPEDFEIEDSDKTEYFAAVTEHDLRDMRDELESERSALILQQGQQNRMATSVTEQINLDAQDLLRLFGIPFIVSPLEAEAQCAFLEAAGLTEGTITDDSDFWLFGGQRMYKNFFNQNKHVELYTMDNIHNHFSLSREQLINIALLCGSDYTEGLQGVGPVRALEIMAEFPGTGLEGLYKFRQWWDKAKKTPGSLIVENKIRARLRNLSLISGFPSEAVVEAYMNPTVDDSTERFSWSNPDLDMLRDFCKFKFGWNKEKSDQTLLPMFKEWTKTQSQGRISSYFGPEAFVQTSKIKSDRLRKALEMVKNPSSNPQDEGKGATRKTTSSKSKSGKEPKAGKKKSKKTEIDAVVENAEKAQECETLEQASKDKQTSKKVSFADKLEEHSDDPRTEDFGSIGRIDNQGETGASDFMLKMSEKVNKAKQELDKMKQARNFACVQPRGGKAVASKGGNATGKGRGGNSRGGKEGKRKLGNNIPISLDVPKKSGMSQRGRSARRGRASSSTAAGAVNLSESSSSDDSDEDDTEAINQRIKSPEMRKLAERQSVSKTPEKPSQKMVMSKVAKAKPKGTNSNAQEEGKKVAKKKTNVSGAVEQGDIVPIKLQSSSVKTKDKIPLRSKKADLSGPDLNPLEVNMEDITPTETLRQDYNTKELNTTSTFSIKVLGGMTTTDNFRGKRKSEIEVENTNIEKKKERNGESIKTTKEKESTDTDKAEVAKSSSKDDDESVDMSKADVSVINRRNMPSTMAYLNQRSRQDKMLLHQISGKRLRNAVELRMEQEERRQPLVLERGRKKEDDEERSNAQEDQDHFVSGVSFEDALFGGDVDSTVSPRVKKRKPNSGKDAGSQSKSIGMVESRVSVTTTIQQSSSSFREKATKSSESPSKIPPNSKKSNKMLNDDLSDGKSFSRKDTKSKEKNLDKKFSKSVTKDTRGMRSLTENEDTSRSAVSTRQTEDMFDSGNGDTKSAIGTRKIEDMFDSDSFFDLESRMLAEQPVREVEKPKAKSNRSRAFDKPIMSGDSFGDSSPSSQGRKFRNQLKHLHEPRSVKGHGPLYVLAPGQEVAARAFAGKGKGRGKNRTSAGVSETSGGFVTAAEREQYGDLTIDDLGSDFSDEDF